MGWAIRVLLVVLIILMIGLFLVSIPNIVSPDFQLAWTSLILILGVNLLFAVLVLFRISKN
ncbi:MAG: hypothetical protein ACFFF4_01020 [Candidatus Thorarchaeota archaeon]